MFPELLGRCASVTPAQAAILQSHYELLCRWNKVLNLTAIDRLEEAVQRHYCESLFLAEHIPAASGLRIADVGSGAGFPGFPIAVVRPECEVTLIESHQRKAVFLREASRGLKNVRVLAKRAEEVREEFDWLVSRAVSYTDLGRLRGLGKRLSLLTGSEEPPTAWSRDWQVVVVPWGKARYLRVSRETER